MSLAILRRCPILGCKFNTHPVFADSSQIKSHLRKHDYKEKQIASFELGLIDSSYEKRSPEWFVESLVHFSKMEGVY